MLTPVDISAAQYIEIIRCPFKICKHALVTLWADIVGKTIKTVLVNILLRHNYQYVETRCVNLNHSPFMMINHPVYAALRFPKMKLLLQIGHFLPATADWQRATQQSHPDNSLHLHLGAEPRSCIYARFSNLIFFFFKWATLFKTYVLHWLLH